MGKTFEFTSADGTILQGWRNHAVDDPSGIPLIISNGLGTTPEAWPALIGTDSGYRACSWYYRGTFGSQRPADPTRIRVEDHVADLLALMDAEGVDRALIACWSIGVNIGFEFAQRYPERVLGLMAVAGVPGGTFRSMGGPLRVPRVLRKPLAVGTAKTMRRIGPALTWLTPKLPINNRTAWLLAHSGFFTPAARPELLVPMLSEFLRHDWRWYGQLAVAASEHDAMDLSFVQCPTSLIAGRRDILTCMHDVVAAAARIEHAQITVLPGSHYLPLEYPEQVGAALHDHAQLTEYAGQPLLR